jgi:hypothetical protein
MKTRLGLEQLEDRKNFSAWSVQVLDSQNLISPQVENQMRAAGNYVMSELNLHVSWKGTLDMLINVVPPTPEYDGFTPSILQVMGGGKNATIYEMQTGIDPMPNSPDLGMTVFMGWDGTVKLYGMKAYFDPDPAPYVPANVPGGSFDFIGVLAHECAHSIAFQAGTVDFNRYITVDQVGNRFFNGPETVRLLGRSLPLTTMGSTHYGNGRLSNGVVYSGLMYEWGNYGGNRLSWGKLDFAVLKDVGINVINTNGLPLVDKMDSQSPRLVTGINSTIKENRAPGTFVTIVTTTLGSNYRFEIVAGADSSNFRISGNTLITTTSFDFETKTSYQIFVRIFDRDGSWVYGKVNVRVADVFENPSLQLPSTITFGGGSMAWFNTVKVSGNNETKMTFFIGSTTGFVEYIGRDPEVRVVSVKNRTGGTNFALLGTVAAVKRNLGLIYYRGGLDNSVGIQICALGRNWGHGEVRLLR